MPAEQQLINELETALLAVVAAGTAPCLRVLVVLPVRSRGDHGEALGMHGPERFWVFSLHTASAVVIVVPYLMCTRSC